ncbi:hypothetical protein XA68_13164 [Ophiocordyceps unilateralis]|uniref:Uncharacterized protein n=1 Tax=Ophiocordyceps unilateralis TaxID=268505 RepID=A0A2A9PDE6_OPHUN|nr:hypothetical protein XA68_13164 [Ophiocordyceps unilateralis]
MVYRCLLTRAKSPATQHGHLRLLRVELKISDSINAGTNNDLYAVIGKGRFHVAHRAWRNNAFTVTIDPRKALNRPFIPFSDLTYVSFESTGGHDQVLLESKLMLFLLETDGIAADKAPFPAQEVTLFGVCSGVSKAARVEREIDGWIADGGTWRVELSPDMWKEV